MTVGLEAHPAVSQQRRLRDGAVAGAMRQLECYRRCGPLPCHHFLDRFALVNALVVTLEVVEPHHAARRQAERGSFVRHAHLIFGARDHKAESNPVVVGTGLQSPRLPAALMPKLDTRPLAVIQRQGMDAVPGVSLADAVGFRGVHLDSVAQVDPIHHDAQWGRLDNRTSPQRDRITQTAVIEPREPELYASAGTGDSEVVRAARCSGREPTRSYNC